MPGDRFDAQGDDMAGWFARRPAAGHAEPNDDDWQPPRDGSVIRLMGDHTVSVPLWSDDGLLFGEPEELVESFGVSSALASALVGWAGAWDRQAGQADHDAQAARLVRRLARELGHRFQFVYQP